MQANIIRPHICISPCLFSSIHFGLPFLHLYIFIDSTDMININQLSISPCSCKASHYWDQTIFIFLCYLIKYACFFFIWALPQVWYDHFQWNLFKNSSNSLVLSLFCHSTTKPTRGPRCIFKLDRFTWPSSTPSW
jgi:hypothetical protein